MAAPNGDQLLKMMMLKKLKKEGSPAFKNMNLDGLDGLDDIEIKPEQEELLGGLVKLFKTADKDFITLAELREFVSVSWLYINVQIEGMQVSGTPHHRATPPKLRHKVYLRLYQNISGYPRISQNIPGYLSNRVALFSGSAPSESRR